MKLKDRFRRWSLSPTARISMGLVSLLVGLLMVLDLVFKLLPDQRTMTQTVREQVAVHLALQVKRMLREPQLLPMIQPMFTDLVEHSPDVQTVAIRRDDGTLVVATAEHEKHWQPPSMGLSTISSVVVPLNTNNGRWGQLEVGFDSPWPKTVAGWLMQPTVQLVAILSTVSFIAFYLYLRDPDGHRVEIYTCTCGVCCSTWIPPRPSPSAFAWPSTP